MVMVSYRPTDLQERYGNQGAFHVVNPEDLRREIELPLGIERRTVYSLGVAAEFYFTLHGVNVGVTALYTIITNDFILVY